MRVVHLTDVTTWLPVHRYVKPHPTLKAKQNGENAANLARFHYEFLALKQSTESFKTYLNDANLVRRDRQFSELRGDVECSLLRHYEL